MLSMRILGDRIAQIIRSDPTGLGQPGFSSLLDLLRWTSALAVLAMHASWRVFVSERAAVAPDAMTGLFYYVTSFGHQAVIVFFVLSGYLVGGKGMVAAAQGRFEPRRYAGARVARLYVVLAPALILTICADLLGGYISQDTSFQSAPRYNHLDWRTALVNVLMLQGVAGPTLGSNTPLWSVAFEFWLYVLFGLGVRSGRGAWLLAVGLGFAILKGSTFAAFAAVWLLGALAAIAPSHVSAPRVRYALLLFAAGLVVSRHIGKGSGFTWPDLTAALGAAFMLWSCKNADLPWLRRRTAMNGAVAGASYSLYATHYPIVLLVLTCLGGPAVASGFSMNLQVAPFGLMIFSVAITASLLFAWFFSLATERHTAKVARWLVAITASRTASASKSSREGMASATADTRQ
jgi:peptidoglycan/LPS O-acetylase OafA/YrhL